MKQNKALEHSASILYYVVIETNNTEDRKMKTYNGYQVALEISKHQYKAFELQAPIFVKNAFGVTLNTAKKWVNRAIDDGSVVRNGRVALAKI